MTAKTNGKILKISGLSVVTILAIIGLIFGAGSWKSKVDTNIDKIPVLESEIPVIKNRLIAIENKIVIMDTVKVNTEKILKAIEDLDR